MKPAWTLSLVASALALVWACKASEKAENTAPGADPAAARAPSERAALVEPITDAEASALVARWLDAQNRGDFAAYSGLFARRMTGVKRAGSRSVAFDRARWLEDRARLFKKPIKVAAEELEVHAGSTSASVSFVQTWESGTYKDVGPKQLVLIREDGDLKIAREEMLSSTVLASQRSSRPVEDSGFRFLTADGRVVLGRAEKGWAKGPIRLLQRAPYIAEQSVDPAALPAEMMALQGAVVTLYGEADACTSTLGALSVVVGVTPHFGVAQEWDDFSGEAGKQASDEERALAIFDMAEGWLVASTTLECKGRFARLGKGKKTYLLEAVEDEELTLKARAAHKSSPGWQNEQKRFETEVPGAGDWDLDGTITTQVFRDSNGNRHLVVVSSTAGDGCGEWAGNHTAVFAVDSRGTFRLLGELESYFQARAAFDLEGDGHVELLGESGEVFQRDDVLLGIVQNQLEELARFGWSYQDCPC